MASDFFHILNLTTESQSFPLGIDAAHPAFSWQIDTDRPNIHQKSYQILLGLTIDLQCPLWDSGRIFSDQSVSVVYSGPLLLPSTRYYWKVIITDNQDNTAQSDTVWFETGLMGTTEAAWEKASFIGAPTPSTNTGALNAFQINVDFLTEKNNKAGIVFSARNKDNFILLEIDMDARRLYLFEYCDNAWDGSFQEGNLPTIVTLGNPDGYPIDTKAVALGREHHWNRLAVTVIPSPDPNFFSANSVEAYHNLNRKELTVTINGQSIINKEAELLPTGSFFLPRRSCLFSIGFRQLHSKACYDNMKISNPLTGEIYQEDSFIDESTCLSALGTCQDSVLIVENRFELVCPVPAVNLTRAFWISKPIQKARLYASARGFYNVWINGAKADEHFYHPGFTDYRLRICYQTFDVTSLLKQGANRILATVGKGYYSGYCGYSGPMNYGEQNSFLARMVVTYKDGSSQSLITDKSWFFSDRGPLIDSDYLDGESYDARLEFTGWEKDDYSAPSWKPCRVFPWPAPPIPTNGSFKNPIPFELSAQNGPMVSIERILTPMSVTENPFGHYIYDFGQNMVGTVRLKVKGKRGLSLKLRYGEMSYPNGEIYIKNVRSAANTDTYTLRGDPNGETFVPSYTSHGFRFVEITGNGFLLDDNDCICSLEGLVLCNTPQKSGDFTCSDPLVNRLQRNIKWSQRGNSLLVYTDCPQRNERMGWTGDAQVFAPTAAFNMDIQAFMNKWLLDIRDGQLMYNKDGGVPDTAPLGGDNRKTACAGWADAAVIVPWEMYLAYGDIRILQDNYECMAKWIDYQSMPSHQNFGLRTVNKKPVPSQSDLASIPYIQVQQPRGDHLTFDESTPFILTATAYAAYVSNLMSRIASILGKGEDAIRYRSRFEKIRQAFQEAWVQPDGSLAYWGEMSKSNQDTSGSVINCTRYSNEEGNPHHPSQTAYALAIDFDLMPQATMTRTAECFLQSIEDRGGHLSVGFLGISHLLPALTKIGENEAAFRLLMQRENPSWLYSVINGATTIWERWNSYIAETGTFGDVSMNSFNHYAYGAIGQWLYRTVLGISSGERPDEAGYKRIYLKPVWDNCLTWAKGWHRSPYGKINSSWERKNTEIHYRCTIPSNTTALLTLPVPFGSKVKIYEGEYAIPFLSANHQVSFELRPGSYTFIIAL